MGLGGLVTLTMVGAQDGQVWPEGTLSDGRTSSAGKYWEGGRYWEGGG